MKKFVILNICALFTFLGCAAAPTATPTVAPTEQVEDVQEESVGYQLFEDEIHNISFEYPSDWEIRMSDAKATYFGNKDKQLSWEQGGISYFILDNPEGLTLQEYLDQEYEICLEEAPVSEVFGQFCFEQNVSEWRTNIEDGHTFIQSDIHGVPESGERAKDVYILKNMSKTPDFFVKMTFVYMQDTFFMDELSGHVLQSILIKDIDESEPLNEEEEYLNRHLGISFTYPGDWGKVELDYEENTHAHLSFSNYGIGMSLYTDGPGIGRGGYWGDNAMYITDQAFIDGYCEDTTFHKFAGNVEKCEIMVNSNNVKYAKVTEENFMMGDESVLATNYYIYNPNSDYRGIMISDHDFRLDNALGYEDEYEEFVDSIKFE